MSKLDKVSDLGDYLREQRQGAKLTLRQLAEAAGVSNPYLSQVERGLRKPSAEVLQQIAKGLRISAEALYVRAGILEERGDRITVETAVLADPSLDERQRRVLLDIYDTFRRESETDGTPPVTDVAPGPRKAARRTTRGDGTKPSSARRATKKSTARKSAATSAATTSRSKAPTPEGN